MPTHKLDLSRLSISQLSAFTGFSTRTVVKRLEGLDPAGNTGKAILYRPREALPRLYFYDNPLSEKMRLDGARADAQEMRNAVARGELIQAAEVGRIGTAIVSAVTMRVLGLRTFGPAARAAGSDAEAAEIIEAGARAALTDLASRP